MFQAKTNGHVVSLRFNDLVQETRNHGSEDGTNTKLVSLIASRVEMPCAVKVVWVCINRGTSQPMGFWQQFQLATCSDNLQLSPTNGF